MTDLELDKLLNEALAKYGLTVKAVTELSHTPTTAVIMMPKSTGRAGSGEARRLPKRSIHSRATQDLLNGHWQRDTVDEGSLLNDTPEEEGECHVLR